jgi:transposase-like protein
MTKAVEVITSVQRRRRWSRAEKERIVAATMEPGAVASEIARAVGIHTSQLFRWRQQLCERAPSGGIQSGRDRRWAGVARLCREDRSDRDRVCCRRPDADCGPGRCLDGIGAAQGAGEEQAATMITVVKGAEPELLHLQIRWQGGATETIDVRRQPNRAEATRAAHPHRSRSRR